jgi:hypothetical protein
MLAVANTGLQLIVLLDVGFINISAFTAAHKLQI